MLPRQWQTLVLSRSVDVENWLQREKKKKKKTQKKPAPFDICAQRYVPRIQPVPPRSLISLRSPHEGTFHPSTNAPSEYSDQTARMHRLILILRWAHVSKGTLSDVEALIGSSNTVEPRYLELAYFELPLISK